MPLHVKKGDLVVVTAGNNRGETGEIITGSGLGEASTVKTASLLDGVDEIKFNQSTIGISTKKALETGASRVVSKMIKKGIFKS